MRLLWLYVTCMGIVCGMVVVRFLCSCVCVGSVFAIADISSGSASLTRYCSFMCCIIFGLGRAI